MENEDDKYNNVNNSTVHPKSCCKTEVKFINNASDFESASKIDINSISLILNSTNFVLLTSNNFEKLDGKDLLIFYNLPIDLSVKYSSLLI